MKPKDFLLQYRRALRRIEYLDKRLQLLYAEAEVQAAAPKPDVVRSSSRVKDRTAELAVKIAEASERLNAERVEAVLLSETVAEVIDGVQDPVLSRLLFDRYIGGLTWEQTASDIGYDPVHTRGRLHGAALIEVQRIIGV